MNRETLDQMLSNRDRLINVFKWLISIEVPRFQYMPLKRSSDDIKTLITEVKRLQDHILRQCLTGQVGESGAAELLDVAIIELREMMIQRYGEDWRDAIDDPQIAKIKMILAGDLDSVLEHVGMTRQQAIDLEG